MTRILLAALGAATSLLAVSPAAAGVVLDQATIPETGHTNFAGGTGLQVGTRGAIQTFTVGVSGFLDHVVVAAENWTFLGAPAGLRLQVQNASYATLVSQDFTAADVPDFGFDGFDWVNALSMSVRAANIAVTAGEQYVLKVAALGDVGNVVWRTGYDVQAITYAGGGAATYDFFPGNPNPFQLGNDFGFRTYVDNGAGPGGGDPDPGPGGGDPDPGPGGGDPPVGGVPEPATWALMLVGFGAAGAGLRRRRRVLAA
ncbi:MAG: PEPxxWA-CTERM sorting domain-containing protein [Phenylobacterium sp.]|uniref:PEPxxWA-CTERM sorting domain-containing protein n=1 Tax=Phenylobacterium sp. TaxID=1871053 RepID=UPI001A4D180F|nr:PEPxxWA-CTERM sorting domain-containing protein [Phenylobacterium sp.]MBL8556893.1 PEPxxWA-CTERM sorting domain-containing protein [Phenylobacterium sp.]